MKYSSHFFPTIYSIKIYVDYTKTGPGGSPDGMDSLKALGPVRTKTPVFLLVGQIPGRAAP